MNKKVKMLKWIFSIAVLFILFSINGFANTETEKLLQEIIEGKTMHEDVYTFINMGNVYFSLGLYEPALAEYEKCLAINEENIFGQINKNYTLYKLEEKEIALENLVRMTTENPNNAFAFYLKGTIYNEMLKYDLAIAEFEKAIELLPNNDKLLCELAQLYQDNDQFIEATEAYIKLGKLKSSDHILDNFLAYKENALVFLNLGNYYHTIGMTDKAVNAFNQAIKFTDDKKSIAMAYYQLAVIDLKGEKYAEAVKEKILSQETYPLREKEFTFDHFAKAFIEIGNMHYSGGNLQKSAKNYELAIQLADSDQIASEAHYKLGITYYRSKDYENALREGESALSLNPDFLSDQERLIDLLIANAWSVISRKSN